MDRISIHSLRSGLAAFSEALFPTTCAGCGESHFLIEAAAALSEDSTPVPVCWSCLSDLSRAPQRFQSAVLKDLPCWMFSAYREAMRTMIIAAKEYLRQGTMDLLGSILAAGIESLVVNGTIPAQAHIVLLAMPTTRRAIAHRGGDIVQAIGTHACQRLSISLPGLTSECLLVAYKSADSLDSVGLSALNRAKNSHKPLEWNASALNTLRTLVEPQVDDKGKKTLVFLFDDIHTTGQSAKKFRRELEGKGIAVNGAFFLAKA